MSVHFWVFLINRNFSDHLRLKTFVNSESTCSPLSFSNFLSFHKRSFAMASPCSFNSCSHCCHSCVYSPCKRLFLSVRNSSFACSNSYYIYFSFCAFRLPTEYLSFDSCHSALRPMACSSLTYCCWYRSASSRARRYIMCASALAHEGFYLTYCCIVLCFVVFW